MIFSATFVSHLLAVLVLETIVEEDFGILDNLEMTDRVPRMAAATPV